MRPHGKYAKVDPNNPQAFGQCDRCSFWYNLKDLSEQEQWAGQQIYGIGAFVCKRCYDTPNEQLRTIILPPDPVSVFNARPPNLDFENEGPVQSNLTANAAQGATSLAVEDVTGFEVGNLVYVQLDNACFAQCQITGIDTVTNTFSILSPLPFSAPNTGVVSVSSTS